MNWPGELVRRMAMLLRRKKFDADLDEEMRLHLELRREQQMKSGMPAGEARAATQRRFGNTTRIKEQSHVTWGWEWFESLTQDIHYGMRAMLRSPVLTAVALISLALGIGANTAIFSLLNAVMLRSLPVKEPSQLVLVGDGTWDGISDGFP